ETLSWTPGRRGRRPDEGRKGRKNRPSPITYIRELSLIQQTEEGRKTVPSVPHPPRNVGGTSYPEHPPPLPPKDSPHMPIRLVERYARHFVSDLRRLTPDTCAWSDDEDAYLSAPLGVRYAYALADLLEYFLDTEGHAGVAEMRA